MKELGKQYASLAMDIAAHNALAVGQISMFRTEKQKRKYLPRLTAAFTSDCFICTVGA